MYPFLEKHSPARSDLQDTGEEPKEIFCLQGYKSIKFLEI